MVAALLYYLLLPFFYLLSLLPFRILYIASDFTYFILFNIIGYRKKVINTNLRNAFPEKSTNEINLIQKRFCHFLCDLFLETFKTLTISKNEMLKRCTINQQALDLFNRYEKEGKSVILVMGHQGNWEWGGNSFSIMVPQQLYVIYHQLANPHFDKLMYNMRSRFGTKLIEMRETFKTMVNNKKEVNATCFIADQTPHPKGAYWTTFLNQDTPVFWGTEKIARKLNLPVIYLHLDKLKRGYYELSAELLVDNPAQTAEGEISELHTRRLEKDIVKCPETWLWSHRRWKHIKPT